MATSPPRKIVHVDMDAFYASVEQRDRPELRDKPVVVAWKGPRSVVCAASYEARSYGIHSAMPALRAARLCPQAVFVAPDFTRYRAVSQQVRAIFARYTSLIEPLSLDEAYLDVSTNMADLPSATAVASAIRQAIREELNLTASAGIAPNKFLAKIASDWRKPDGQFVIKPQQVETFLQTLPVGRIPGVGRVTRTRLERHDIETVGQLRERSLVWLQQHFGSTGGMLYRRARGIDENPVQPHRPVQSISAEDTLTEDLPLERLPSLLPPLARKVWQARTKTRRQPRTIVLKLKTADFRILTRSHTPAIMPGTLEDFLVELEHLFQRVNLPPTTRYRLLGVGLGNFFDGGIRAA